MRMTETVVHQCICCGLTGVGECKCTIHSEYAQREMPLAPPASKRNNLTVMLPINKQNRGPVS